MNNKLKLSEFRQVQILHIALITKAKIRVRTPVYGSNFTR